MEEDRTKDDPMEIVDQSEDARPPYNTPLGSPFYGPPPLEEEGKKRMRGEEYDSDEERNEEDHETEEDRAARRKAKGKAKASSPPEDDGKSDYDSEYPNTSRSHPTAAADTDMDAYWAHDAHLAHENAAGKESPDEMYFGDADAAMNDAISSSSSPSSYSPNNKENVNTPPGAPNNSPERRQVGWVDSTKLKRKLEEVQHQQREYSSGRGRGRGRGKGAGTGWGLAWQETMTQESAEREGWGAHGSPPPSSSELKVIDEETGWEEYDYSAWEKAAEEAAAMESGKVLTLKVPQSASSAKPIGAEGSAKHSIDPATAGTVKKDDLVGQRVELVRAVRNYKAILDGTFLSYKKDDVMRVVHRGSDGSLIFTS